MGEDGTLKWEKKSSKKTISYSFQFTTSRRKFKISYYKFPISYFLLTKQKEVIIFHSYVSQEKVNNFYYFPHRN